MLIGPVPTGSRWFHYATARAPRPWATVRSCEIAVNSSRVPSDKRKPCLPARKPEG
jgi:hypothetical protein